MSRSFGTEDSDPWFGGTSTNPVGLFGRNEPPSRFPDNLGPEGYDEDFDPPLENIYECPICLLGLREPLQTPCGHRFCRACILRSIRYAGPKCPVDNEHLEEWQLNADNFAKREVLNLYVFCPWKQLYECSWKGRLSGLENHFQDCPQYPMSCEKCGKENIQNNEMQDHNEKECPRAELKCPFNVVGCPFEGPRTAVNEHVREQMVSHLTLMFGQTGLQAQRQAIQLARLEREIVDLRSFAIGNGAELRRRTNGAEIDTLKARVENLERQLQELTARFNRQETRAFEFEGTEFRQHMSESLIAKPKRLAFQRPIAPRNYKSYGYVELPPIDHIRDPQYIKNNTMLVRIQINH